MCRTQQDRYGIHNRYPSIGDEGSGFCCSGSPPVVAILASDGFFFFLLILFFFMHSLSPVFAKPL